mgnify:CR=1 FL=1
MQTEMKCPTCGGDKYKFLGGNTFKCAYCGATFVNEQQAPEPPVEAPKQTEVITRVEYIPQQQTSSQGTGNSVVKGMAQGAGAAAGGCLTGTLMAVLIPIIAIVIIFAFIGSCIDGCTSALF